MILTDTSVWISFLRNSDQEITNRFKAYLKRNEVVAISAVFGELLQGAKGSKEREIIYLLWENLPKINEHDLFIKAGEISNSYHLYAKGVGLIDCFILCAALENNLLLWTHDKKLQSAYEAVVSP